jgi:hypothetical protein
MGSVPKKRILTSSNGWVRPLAAWQATTEERGAALSSFVGARIIRELERNAARGDLIALHVVASGAGVRPERDVANAVLVAGLEEALTRRRLLLVPEGGAAAAKTTAGAATGAGASASAGGAAPETDEDRLVKTVMADQATIRFEGTPFRLVPVARLSEQKGREFRPVPDSQSRELLGRMAARLAKTPAERAAWEKLAGLLTDRRTGAGVVLLRNLPSPAVSSAEAPAPVATPSQARPKIAEDAWIEILIQYDDGSPFDGSCVVELPDGRKTEGPPDGDGVVRMKGIDPGSCKLSFPTLDAAAWAAG